MHEREGTRIIHFRLYACLGGKRGTLYANINPDMIPQGLVRLYG